MAGTSHCTVGCDRAGASALVLAAALGWLLITHAFQTYPLLVAGLSVGQAAFYAWAAYLFKQARSAPAAKFSISGQDLEKPEEDAKLSAMAIRNNEVSFTNDVWVRSTLGLALGVAIILLAIRVGAILVSVYKPE